MDMAGREQAVRRWFSMWLEGRDTGILQLFAPDALYIESWGPEYRGAQQIKHWFEEWNTRGKVLAWDIRGFFHREDRTVVEWYFENKMYDGTAEIFDGLSLVDWDRDGFRSLDAIFTGMTPMPMAQLQNFGKRPTSGFEEKLYEPYC